MSVERYGRRRKVRRSAVLAGLVGLLAGVLSVSSCTTPAPGAVSVTNPLTLGQGAVFGNDSVTSASVSGDGDVVAFVSAASNLVPNDTNGVPDLFVRVVSTGVVTRAVAGATGEPRVSQNGRYVSFRTSSGQLGVLDRTAGIVSTWTPSGLSFPYTPVVPADGSSAITGASSFFGAFTPGCQVHDLTTGTDQDCPHGGPGFGTVQYEAASPNGRYVLYFWNDQSGGGTSARLLWDRTAGTTIVVPAAAAFFPAFVVLADDGNTIAFTQVTSSGIGTLAVFDVAGSVLMSMPGPLPTGNIAPSDISADGNLVTFLSDDAGLVAGDTNGTADLFQWNVAAGTVVRTSLAVGTGAQLPGGVRSCGAAPGQVRANGTGACALTSDAAVVTDTNGFVDGYKFG